jgi:hypothetical protein
VADGNPKAPARRRDASSSVASTLGPPSNMRASSAARSASRLRCSASLARDRASSATALAMIRGDEEDGERHPVATVRDREAPRRREMEEVEGRGAGDAREHAQPQPPDRRHEQDGQQVRDSARSRRRDLAQREDQAGDRRHRQRRHHQADEDGRGIGAQQTRRAQSHEVSLEPVLGYVPAASYFRLPRERTVIGSRLDV